MTTPIRLEYTVNRSNIDESFTPLIDDIIASYRSNHPNLISVYIFGSLALDQFYDGLSDIDVIGICDGEIDPSHDAMRRQSLLEIGDNSPDITFIDSAVINSHDIAIRHTLPLVDGHVFKLATSGVCVWGENMNFTQYLPTRDDLANSRVHRVELLMIKYRSGNIIEAFRREPKLLTRSCAKAALRVLSSIIIRKGAPFHPSPSVVATDIETYAPELIPYRDRAMEIVNHPNTDVESAIELAESCVALYQELFTK